MRSLLTFATLCVAVLTHTVTLAGETISYEHLVSRLTDFERLATPIVEGEKTFTSTSHDRASRYNDKTSRYENWSANRDGSGSIRREGDAQVMVDLEGPGVLWRTWSAKAEGGHIKIFIDGLEKPIIDKPFRAYFNDLEKDYPGLAMTLSRGRNEYVPISFSKSCKVIVERGWGMYFHCTHTIFPEGTKVEPFPGFTPEVQAVLKKASNLWVARGSNPYPDGATAAVTKKTLILQPGKSADISLAGAGAIRVFKVTPLELPDERIKQEDILRDYFPLMINAWRDAFGQREMPFISVQLPKLSARDVRDAAPTRESQMWTAKNVKNTGMVVTLDVGEPSLHPKLKRPIGRRLAKLAQAKVYGKEVEHASPLYRSAKVEGSQIVIQFDHVDKGLESNDGQPLREFTICGADRKFVPADAKIIGNTVVVSSTKVGEPVAVRYAWKNDPIVNLFGKNGLPVGPFRTDSFKLIKTDSEK